MRRIVATLAFALAAGVGGAGAAVSDRIAWERDFDEALRRAKAEGKPILVAFNMDGEVANDEVARDHYADAKIVSLSRRFACLLGSIGEHGAAADGTCPRFGSLSCAEHREIEKKARRRFIEGNVVRAPQHVLASPEGDVIFRKVYILTKDELRRAMAIALGDKAAASDPAVAELAAGERARVDALLEKAKSANDEVRQAAFRDLAQSEDPRALQALLDRAKPGNDDLVRYAAIHALGTRGKAGAVKPLVQALGDRNRRVRLYALDALERTELPEAVPDLLAYFKRERDDRTRGRALRAAAACLPESAEVREAVVGALRDRSQHVQESALVAASRLPADPKVLSAVAPFLRDRGANARGLAVWVIGGKGDRSHAAVLEKMAGEDSSAEVRETAARALRRLEGEEAGGYERIPWQFFTDDLWEVAAPPPLGGGGGDR